MSVADILRTHLHDTVHLCNELFDAFASSSLNDNTLQSTVLINIELLRRKDEMIRATNRRIADQLRRDQQIQQLRSEIASLDSDIVSFATTLSEMEEEFYALQEQDEMRNSRELNGELVAHPLSVHELLVSSERYGLVSFAPADYMEHRGLSSTKPPAPLEQQMSTSLLQLSVDDLLEWVKRKEVELASRIAADTKATEQFEGAFDDDFFPSAITNSAQSQALPSFQELSAAAPAVHSSSSSSITLQHALPTQFLDLELNAQSDSDDDDDDDDDGDI
jgi:hypothetical protein